MGRRMGFGNHPDSERRLETPYDKYLGRFVSVSSGGQAVVGVLASCEPIGQGYSFGFGTAVYREIKGTYTVFPNSDICISTNGSSFSIYPQKGTIEEHVEALNLEVKKAKGN